MTVPVGRISSANWKIIKGSDAGESYKGNNLYDPAGAEISYDTSTVTENYNFTNMYYRKVPGSTTWGSPVAAVFINPYQDVTAQQGQQYQYDLKPCSDQMVIDPGTGDLVEEEGDGLLNPLEVCITPDALSFSSPSQTDRNISLSWEAQGGPVGYLLYRDGQNRKELEAVTSYIDTGLVPDQTYSYTIRTVFQSGGIYFLSKGVTLSATTSVSSIQRDLWLETKGAGNIPSGDINTARIYMKIQNESRSLESGDQLGIEIYTVAGSRIKADNVSFNADPADPQRYTYDWDRKEVTAGGTYIVRVIGPKNQAIGKITLRSLNGGN